jgi:hypothetical protein
MGGKDSGEGWTSVDVACSGRSSTVICVEVKEQIYQRIRDNRRLSTDETVSEMSIILGRRRDKNNSRPNIKYFSQWNRKIWGKNIIYLFCVL